MRADSSTISLTDEAALSWYFGQGLSIYERSTFGAILAKLIRDSCGSESCSRCAGTGILDSGGVNVENKCKTCGGDGRVARRWCDECQGLGKVEPYEVQVASGGWCPTCRGTGSRPLGTAQRRTPCRVCQAPNPRALRTRLDSRAAACANCVGTGVEPITARPLQAGEATGVQADDSALTRFAITSRRVERLRAQKGGAILATALSVYYGDIGQRWALAGKGRMFSLYHLTGPGRKLARWGEKATNADLDLTAQERIGTQAAIEAGQPILERRKLLVAAEEQAQALYARAARAWNQQGAGKRERAAWDRLLVSLGRLGGHDDLVEAIGREMLGNVRKASA